MFWQYAEKISAKCKFSKIQLKNLLLGQNVRAAMSDECPITSVYDEYLNMSGKDKVRESVCPYLDGACRVNLINIFSFRLHIKPLQQSVERLIPVNYEQIIVTVSVKN